MGSASPHSPASVVVPGNHDGVHRGHAALLSRASELARARGARVLALTFHPHPLALLAPERAPEPLTTIERRVQLLRASGADHVEVARFDAEYAALDARAFVERELVRRLSACAVIVGADYRFGHGRAGDPALLRALGEELGFEVEVVSAVGAGAHARVSSTLVREALRAGDVPRVRELLGRPHELEGLVVSGDRRGRTIGYPTANLGPLGVMLPPDGVYAVCARAFEADHAVGGPLRFGMMNVGTRPTFAAGRSVEVHLFDFEGDLYGRRLRVGLVARLRDEQRFAGLDALVAQLGRDALAARDALASLAPLASMLT